MNATTPNAKPERKRWDVFVRVGASVRMIFPSKYLVNRHQSKTKTELDFFIGRHSGIDSDSGLDRIYDMNRCTVMQAEIEKELLQKYSPEGFYRKFVHALPKMFWYDADDEEISRYHWILTRVWPNAFAAMIATGVPRDEHMEYSKDQRYADAFSDVMRQIVMESLAGEVKGTKSQDSKVAQKSRQFVLKFMMDAEAMAKAYIHTAKVETDKLPSVDRQLAYERALGTEDPTNPNNK